MQPQEVLKADEIDLSDLPFWIRPLEEREGAFATLRRERPISFHEEPWVEGLPFPEGPGVLGDHPPCRHPRGQPQRRRCSARAGASTSPTCLPTSPSSSAR